MAKRFRGFLPVVVDVETAGFNCETDALLEIAAVLLQLNADGTPQPTRTLACHLQPFPGANLEAGALKFNRIDPYHPFRQAVPETEGLETIFNEIRTEVNRNECQRAILVGHNPSFDLSFIHAAVRRNQIKANPFHAFSCFDTATLAALAYGQTVLRRASEAAGLSWDEDQAHSAIYDAERTSELFCTILNRWHHLQRLEKAQRRSSR